MLESALPSVIVVNDAEDNANIIPNYLEPRGYRISVAYSGDEAIQLFESEKPFELAKLASVVERNTAQLNPPT